MSQQIEFIEPGFRNGKICNACKVLKPLSEYRDHNLKTRVRVRPICKICQRAYEGKWRQASAEKLRKARFIRSPKAKEYSRKYRAKFRAFYLVKEIKRRCKTKGIPFDLDSHIDEIQSRIEKGICEVSGHLLDISPLNFKWERRPNTPSIDKRIPSHGYIYSNIRIVCVAVNFAMSTWGESGFLPIAEMWIKNKGNQ